MSDYDPSRRRHLEVAADRLWRVPKIAICGHGRSGKDTAADYLASITPLAFVGSTSQFLLPYVVKRTGEDPEVAWRTRHENRKFWYDLGNELRAKDPGVLVKAVLARGDMAVGCRDGVEVEWMLRSGAIDLAVWIEREVPPDPTLTYGNELCDFAIDNDGTLADFHERLHAFAVLLGLIPPSALSARAMSHIQFRRLNAPRISL